MERFEITTTTAGADDLVLVHADTYIDGPENPRRVAKLRGDLFRNRTLHVGYIETDMQRRRTGVATRLLLHTIEVLAVARVTAVTVDGAADAFFAKVGASAGIEVETD